MCYSYKKDTQYYKEGLSVPLRDLEVKFLVYYKTSNPSAAGMATFIFQTK